MRFITYVLILTLSVAMPIQALPVCADRDAKIASDEYALGLFRKQGEIFHPSRVFKRHHTSRHKEVGSYVKVKEKHYSIFTLVDTDCNARFIKRTRQGD
ncbi:MAG: hypothetical protein ACPGGD_04715 [Thalassolituus sp.]